MKRIPDDLLLAFASGELPPDEAERVRAALRRNPRAAATVAAYRAAAEAVRADDSVEAPSHVLEKARAIFDPSRLPRRGLDRWFADLERTIASLIFDSRVQPVPVRLHPSGDEFQMTWQIDDTEVDLQATRIAPGRSEGPRWVIDGQLTADTPATALRIAVTRAGTSDAIVETVADEHSAFSFELPDGTYDLMLGTADGVAALTDIRLG